MKKIELSESVEAARARMAKLIAGRETHVYEQVQFAEGITGCANVVEAEDGTVVGSCLIGQYLMDLAGDEAQEFGQLILKDGLEMTAITDLAPSLDDVIELPLNVDNVRQFELGRYLMAVQDAQDTGTPWGAAIELDPLTEAKVAETYGPFDEDEEG